ncbi:hypothetical protein MRB53_000521 [Persea americana]|uniref:Uncharacterized protein n=1 Tax=Persea americana TaxID=3435 RepID=A0ACC2MPD3_PERAE|nr:hypothetical protein MRB53_000521 [Persea americana]
MACILGAMAVTSTTAHVSAVRNRIPTAPVDARPSRQPCAASFPQSQSRRSASISLLLVFWCSSNPKHAYADGIFDKYVKRKKLDPLEAYVPAVLLTQSQFEELEETLEDDQPKYSNSRSLLRSGPAASLRVNIRAVAQYASDNGRGKAAFDAVDRCLGALEDLDSLLLHASRNDPTATVESMKKKMDIALGALDSLLQTVPSTVLDKGKAIADAYMTPSDPEDGKLEDLDPDLKQLEKLL